LDAQQPCGADPSASADRSAHFPSASACVAASGAVKGILQLLVVALLGREIALLLASVQMLLFPEPEGKSFQAGRCHMRKQRDQSESTVSLRLWTYAEANKALPYIRAVVDSVREHWLEWQRARLQLKRLDARPGRPDRHALILRENADRDAERAHDELREALQELNALDIVCLDAVQGLALIPFDHGNDLAWFVFDLFAPNDLAWLFDSDPSDTRRPLFGTPALASTAPTAAIDHLMARGASLGNWPASVGDQPVS